MSPTRKHTLCVPKNMSDKLDKTYNALLEIDCNFSKIIQCLLDSILNAARFIIRQRKNFRHYHWHIVIQDKETKQYYSEYPIEKTKST